MSAGGPRDRLTGLVWFPVVVLCLLLGACADGIPRSVLQAVDATSSAVASARLAAALDSSGQLTEAAATTAVKDALVEVGQARATLVQLSPTSQTDRTLRAEALAVIEDCTSAMTAAAEALASDDRHPALTDAEGRMGSAAAVLSELRNRLGGP